MSADPLGELVEISREARRTASNPNAGIRERVAIEAVERAVNLRWLEMLPAGALMCGCGDIEVTGHRCGNCEAFSAMEEPKHHIAFLLKMRSDDDQGWDHFGPFDERAAAEAFAEETYRDDLDNSWVVVPLYLVATRAPENRRSAGTVNESSDR